MSVCCTIFSVTADDLPDRFESCESVSLDKLWDAIHWAFGNERPGHPRAFIRPGGEAVEALENDAVNNGRYIEPGQVRQIAASLADLTDEQMVVNLERRRHSTDRYTNIDLELSDVAMKLRALRRLVRATAAASHGLLVIFDGMKPPVRRSSSAAAGRAALIVRGRGYCLRFGEDLGGEALDLGVGLAPGARGKPGLAAGLVEKLLAVESLLDGHLRQQQPRDAARASPPGRGVPARAARR